MGLTNAERQARFRQRLKARASGADLGEQARAAVDAGLAVVWADLVRTNDASVGADAFGDLAAFQRSYADKPADALLDLERWLHPDMGSELSEDERAAVESAVAIYRAALLRHLPAEPKPARSRKRAG